MAQWLTYGLQVEIIAIGMFIYGFAVFLKAIKHISEEFKLAIVLVLLCLIMEVLQGVMVRVLLFKEILYDNPLWLISPFLGVIGAFFLILGARKFVSEIEK